MKCEGVGNEPRSEKSGSLCSLEDMLAARDRRNERQRQHFLTTPNITLVVATVVAPGEQKLSRATDVVADAMEDALRLQFAPHIITLDRHAYVSGHEVWLTLSCSPVEAKQAAVRIEDTHRLGRLFDIDVIQSDLRPMSRKDIGMAPRKCLLCDNEARLCMRMRLHTPEDIKHHIETLVHNYSDAK